MFEQQRVTANGVDFAFLAIGDSRDPLALCLHGFPDCARTWRHLLPRLADAGFRAVAPYQRGYAPTAVPADGLYQSGVLGVDANALHAALDADERAVIIGHDWGASGTWSAAGLAPTLWRKVVGMAVPPGDAIAVSWLTRPALLKLSWYMFFFQSPLAEMAIAADDLAFLDMLWADWSPGYDAADDLPEVKDALRDPRNLAAAIGYYRATIGEGRRDTALAAAQAATMAMPTQPTLYLHGRDDGCIGVEVAELMAAGASGNVRTEILDGAGHFLHLEQPDRVGDLVLDFLTAPD